jgi:hypothetical protein
MFSLCHYGIVCKCVKNIFNQFWIQAVTTKIGISKVVWILSEGTVCVSFWGVGGNRGSQISVGIDQ